MHSQRWALAAFLCLFTFAAQAQVQIAAPAAETPYTLTAADGTGLVLVGLKAKAIVDGPLAFTELHLTFQNPQPRQIEGHFKITMPESAAISRFAMMIRGGWMEGEVVEKQAARRAYEDALHRRQDPALLEQDSGNSFRARVFPIGPNERKQIIISWSQELLKSGEAYRLPLKGLPKIEHLELTAMTTAKAAQGPKSSLGGETSRYQITKVEKRGFTPDQDWVIYGGEVPASGDALRNENLAMVRFTVPGQDAKIAFPNATILFDTSASRAINFEGRIQALSAFTAALKDAGVTQVEIIAFDQSSEVIWRGAPAALPAQAVARLKERGALGASDLSVGLKAAAATKLDKRRLILFTDGMVTAGARDLDALQGQVTALGMVGFQRADVVVDTTARDALVLEGLVTSSLTHAGKVIEGRAPLAEQLNRLSRATSGRVLFEVPGAKWIWPSEAKGLQGGDLITVFADLQAGAPFNLKITGLAKPITVTPAARDAEKQLLHRAWVAARIKRLLKMQSKSDPDMRGALKQQIITLSTKHRVLSPFTALVVLETEYDYQRFGIQRNALADILTVGMNGLEVLRRTQPYVAPPPPPKPAPIARRSTGRKGKATKKSKRRAPRRFAARDGDDREMAKAAEAPRLDDVAFKDEAPAAAPVATGAAMPMEEADEVAEGAPGDGFGRGLAGGAPAPTPAPSAAAPEPEPEMKRESERTEAPRVETATIARPAAIRRPPPAPPAAPLQLAAPTGESVGRRELRDIEKGRAALDGKMADLVELIDKGKTKDALKMAKAWRAEDATDLLAAVGLGRAYMAAGDHENARRAFGSVIDLYPSRADMRRLAGGWLSLLGPEGLALAADTYRVAMEQRPDHPSVYHQLGMALVRIGQHEEALNAVLKGITARRVENRFPGVVRILQEDAQLIAAAWAAKEPKRKDELVKRLQAHNLRIDNAVQTRFVLTWETDSNDVDFHIFDGKYNHAYYSRRTLATGGELYADVTTGYGPECFTIYGAKAHPYRLKAHYYRRGPMGYGAGAIQIIRHDGQGNFGFEDRPFVIMQDGAYVDLGKVEAKTAKIAK